MRFTAALFALPLALTGVNADLVAFSGFNCQGDEGDNIACDGSCNTFGARNSFSVLTAGPVFVSVYTDIGCSNEVGNFTNAGNGACNNISPGGTTTNLNIQSFICSSNITGSTIVPSTTASVTTASQIVVESSSASSSSTASSVGSTSTAKSSASPNKKILHWTGALLGLVAGNLLVF